MGSDRARRSFDETRQYRRVVPQQGRVFVEADFNEAQEISTEEVRKEALDFVGPAGTPDNGYEVGSAKPPDFSVGPGTMYVGGLRVTLAEAVTYDAQKEWLDKPLPQSVLGNELVMLMLAEQEVSAVEDTALLDVALGGPDTAQRTRIVQRFERFAVSEAITCEEADAVAEPLFADGRGYSFDPETMRLLSFARLSVDYDTGTPDDPCAPETQQGYLGAENQLIRVQVSSPPGPDGKILWAFDNASSLYRVEEAEVSGTTTKLTLAARPIDAQHEPKGSQRIEVLRAAVELDAPGDYMAAHTGLVAGLTASYDPETRSITIDTALGGEYLDQLATPALFVRVWEQELPFTPGTPVTLGTTGVRVNLSLAASGGGTPVFALGDYWLIGVRPGMPLSVLPRRFESPEEPDGPRLWACPLAVIEASDKGVEVLDDCREHFDNLVELSKEKGPCCIVVSPDDVGGGSGLQALIDEHALGVPYCISLKPGTYQIPAPLVLGSQHSGLTLEACSKGVTLQAVPGTGINFLRGLVEMTYADDVTFEGIRFDRPAGGPLVNPLFTGLGALFAIGIRPMFCKNLTVRRCTFNFTLFLPVYPIGVFAGGNMDGLTVEDCQFTVPANPLIQQSAGVVLVPAVEIFGTSVPPGGTPAAPPPVNGTGYTRGEVVRSSMASGTIRRNRFTSVTLPVLICADTGRVTIEENKIEDAGQGIVLMPLAGIAFGDGKAVVARLENALVGVPNASTISLYVQLAWAAQISIIETYSFYPRTASVNPSDVLHSSTFSASDVNAAFYATVAVLEQPPTTMLLDLQIAHNEVTLGPTSPLIGIFVLDYRTDALSPAADGKGVVDANLLSMTGAFAGAMIILLERGSVTGNVIASRQASGSQFHPFSLIVVRGTNSPGAGAPTYGRAAITGNVLQGTAVLPLRPPSLQTSMPWIYLNHDEG